MQGWRNKATRFSKNSGRGQQRRYELRQERRREQQEPSFHSFASENTDVEPVPTFDEPVMTVQQAPAETLEAQETDEERRKRLKRESAARSRAKKKAEAQQLAA